MYFMHLQSLQKSFHLLTTNIDFSTDKKSQLF